MPRTAPFDALPERYDDWFERHPREFAAEVRAVRTLLPSGEGAVEVGVGTGRFAQALGIGLGVEPSEAAAERARARGIQVVSGAAEALPLGDGLLEAVLLATTICFVDDPALALAESRRVLRPGGAVVLGFVDLDSPLGRLYARRAPEHDFYRDATFYTAAQVRSLLEEAGFVEITAVQTLLEPPDEDAVVEGSGRGGFVILRGLRPLRVRAGRPKGEGTASASLL